VNACIVDFVVEHKGKNPKHTIISTNGGNCYITQHNYSNNSNKITTIRRLESSTNGSGVAHSDCSHSKYGENLLSGLPTTVGDILDNHDGNNKKSLSGDDGTARTYKKSRYESVTSNKEEAHAMGRKLLTWLINSYFNDIAVLWESYVQARGDVLESERENGQSKQTTKYHSGNYTNTNTCTHNIDAGSSGSMVATTSFLPPIYFQHQGHSRSIVGRYKYSVPNAHLQMVFLCLYVSVFRYR
jgi:hypothetical protein